MTDTSIVTYIVTSIYANPTKRAIAMVVYVGGQGKGGTRISALHMYGNGLVRHQPTPGEPRAVLDVKGSPAWVIPDIEI